ncbi:MAG: ABC transporter permease [Thiolinea sp.]
MFIALLFIVLIGLIIWSYIHGRKVIQTEKSDAVFGNPTRALGGWHWTVMGVSTVLLFWLYFSWDAGRAFFPQAANEVCQVAKLNRSVVPVRSAFPLDERLLRGTQLIQRDSVKIEQARAELDKADFNDADKAELNSIIDELEAAMHIQASPDAIDPAIAGQLSGVADRINKLADAMSQADYPGPADPAQQEKANAQPAWGATNTEIPTLPLTDRGRKFDAASIEMEVIAKDFAKIRNNTGEIKVKLDALKARYKGFKVDESGDEDVVAERKSLVKQIDKIYKRIDDGKIFPPSITEKVEASLIKLDDAQSSEQGTLKIINALAMPGGTIMAGNNACSEQGSGRWLPKPSDTWNTFIRLAHPDEGYKGVPLLWYEKKPLADMAAFFIPDWVADLVPGEYPRHDANGQIEMNLKGKVYNVATGNFPSPSIPVPIGHVWDSMLRVLAGLFFGILLGVPLGLAMGLSRFFKGFFDPLIELYRPIPPLAWAPLILTIFGIGDDGKIFLLFMVAFAIMVISARTGATGTHLSKIHAAHSLGASKKQIIRQVILPNSLPEILTGIRIAIGVCWGTLVAAEMLAGTTGIGFVENVARKQSDYEIIWTTIIIMGLLGLLFDVLMRWVINKTIPWRGKG